MLCCDFLPAEHSAAGAAAPTSTGYPTTRRPCPKAVLTQALHDQLLPQHSVNFPDRSFNVLASIHSSDSRLHPAEHAGALQLVSTPTAELCGGNPLNAGPERADPDNLRSKLATPTQTCHLAFWEAADQWVFSRPALQVASRGLPAEQSGGPTGECS